MAETGCSDGLVAVYELTLHHREGQWVYDDPVHGRHGEALVMGSSEVIDGLRLLDLGLDASNRTPTHVRFSAAAFPEAHQGEWIGSGEGSVVQGEIESGDWYRILGQECWLCPALLDWFESPPVFLFVRCSETAQATSHGLARLREGV
jgi:hypothetical protein